MMRNYALNSMLASLEDRKEMFHAYLRTIIQQNRMWIELFSAM